MLISSIKNYKKILDIFPQLDIVFKFILNNINAKTEDGRYNITKDIYAVVEKSLPKLPNERLLEKHKKYMDLQYIIKGCDNIGWKFFDNKFKVYKKYNFKKDIAFYKDKPDIFIKLKKGDFAIFFTEDSHAPLCNEKTVKKCIVKIPADFLINK